MASNQTIGDFLASRGCKECIWWGSSPHILRTSLWANGAAWNGRDTRGTYTARYGYINEGRRTGSDGKDDPTQADLDRSLLSAGTTVGEETGGGSALRPALQQLAQRADNPLKLVNHSSYIPTAQDEQDVAVVKDPTQKVAVWKTIFLPLLQPQVPQ